MGLVRHNGRGQQSNTTILNTDLVKSGDDCRLEDDTEFVSQGCLNMRKS